MASAVMDPYIELINQLTGTSTSATADDSLTICLYVTGNDWDHYLVFAMTEINSGMYQSTLGDITFPYKILYANPSSEMVEGEAQQVFSRNYESCSVFVGPAWTTQLSAIGEGMVFLLVFFVGFHFVGLVGLHQQWVKSTRKK